jgi:hypothetical protein
MRKKTAVLLAFSVIVALVAGTSAFAGSGCSKSAAKQAAQTAGAHPDCCGAAATAEGQPCCPRMATEQALVALKTAASESGCSKAQAAVETAELAVKKAEQTTGCSKSKAAAEQAAMVALKDAAEATGCDKAKAAVETALVAYNEQDAAAEKKDAVQ